MTDVELRLSVRVAWWVRPLLWSWARFYALTGIPPNVERLQKLLLLGVRPVVNKVRRS